MGNADVVLVIMVLFTLVAFPLFMLGHCTAILRFTPSKAPGVFRARRYTKTEPIRILLTPPPVIDSIPPRVEILGPNQRQVSAA